MGLFDWLFGKSKPAQAHEDRPPTLQSGGRVLALWGDGYFYPGRIRQVQGDSCEIAFDDGDIALVHQANVRQPDIKSGSQVFCRFKAGPAYLPGKVEQQT